MATDDVSALGHARRRRPGPSVRASVTEHTPGATRRRDDRLATEEPLEIRLAAPGTPARRVWVTMRTPGHDFELSVGYLHNEGLITAGDIRQVAYCSDEELADEEEFNVVTVTTEVAVDVPHRHDGVSAGSSACGVCGKDSVAEVLQLLPRQPWSGGLPAVDAVRRLPQQLRERQSLFARTGGVHAAGLADETGAIDVVREDVGRHNAVDKVIGARLLGGRSPAAACLVVSGRAGFELVQKAAAAGIGSLVAVGAPSSLAVRLATESQVALFGFASAHRVVQYC